MLDKALAHLTKQIDEKVARMQEALGTGVAKDYPEYQRMCGEGYTCWWLYMLC